MCSEADSEVDTPNSRASVPAAEGIDEDEYYEFLREMGCDFHQDEEDVSDDEGSSCSEDEDDDDDHPTTNAPAAQIGVAPAICRTNLPVFQDLDADGLGAAILNSGYPVQQIDRCGPERAKLRLGPTNIAPGPSIWLLQALKVAKAAASTTPDT